MHARQLLAYRCRHHRRCLLSQLAWRETVLATQVASSLSELVLLHAQVIVPKHVRQLSSQRGAEWKVMISQSQVLLLMQVVLLVGAVWQRQQRARPQGRFQQLRCQRVLGVTARHLTIPLVVIVVN